MNKVILFDLDGTLIDTLHLYIESYLKTIERYPDIELLTLDEIKELNPTSEYRTLEKIIGKARAGEAYRVFMENYRRAHDDCFRGVYPGVLSMLETLREKGFTLGIVTGKSNIAWEVTSMYVRLGKFDVVITDDDVTEPKPHPEGIIKAMNILNVPGEETDRVIYIGDSLSDLMAADAAGVIFGAALWSYWAGTEKITPEIKRKKGHFILGTPSELTDRVASN